MKCLLPVFLTLTFAGIAVFGFFAMGHSGQCIAETIQGTVCPKDDFVEVSGFFIGAFKIFTSAAGLVFAVLLAISIALIFYRKTPTLANIFNKRKAAKSYAPPVKTTLDRWLALHFNSPNPFGR